MRGRGRDGFCEGEGPPKIDAPRRRRVSSGLRYRRLSREMQYQVWLHLLHSVHDGRRVTEIEKDLGDCVFT